MQLKITLSILLCIHTFIAVAQCDLDAERQQLIELYTALNGEKWGTLICPVPSTREMRCDMCTLDSCKTSVAWDTSQVDFSNWYGVSVNNDGCIRSLDFDGDTTEFWASNFIESGICMKGQLPNAIVLPKLKTLTIQGNECVNSPLPDFSGCPDLDDLILGNMDLYGPMLVDYFENLPLFRLNLANNNLEGTIPGDIAQRLPDLNFLYLHNNNFQGTVPDVSSLELDFFHIQGNQFTFTDLLLYFYVNDTNTLDFKYAPQKPIFNETTFSVGLGLPFVIDLEVDDTVQSNTYYWFHETAAIDTTQQNQLRFDSIQMDDAGTYHCEVTNSIVQNLTLSTYPITIEPCQPSITQIDTTLCPGESLELPSGQLLDRDSLIIFRNEAANGCDSALYVTVNYHTETAVTTVDTSICQGERVVFDEEIFEQTGSYNITLANANQYGCDSAVLLNLTVVQPVGEAAAVEEDRVVCTPDNHFVSATLPNDAVGLWRLPPNVTFTATTSSDIEVSTLAAGVNRIGWIINKPGCPPYDSAFIELYYEPPPLAVPDRYTIQDAGQEYATLINLIENDTGFHFLLDREIQLFGEPPEHGKIESIDPQSGDLLYLHQPRYRGIDSFYYQISSSYCPENRDTALVIIEIVPKERDTDIPPNVITPNGDRMNDTFIIPLIKKNPTDFPNSHLRIYSYENKTVLFERKGYQNDWDGSGNNGIPLPDGEYYFVIEYGTGIASHQGPIFIIRSKNP